VNLEGTPLKREKIGEFGQEAIGPQYCYLK